MPSLLTPPKVKPSLLHLQRPTIRKPKLLRSNPARLSLILKENDEGYLIDDEAILSGYRVRTILSRSNENNEDEEDIELSDYVKFRLWLARQLALKKYHEKWG